jgi:CheY-like chemotaxis protein
MQTACETKQCLTESLSILVVDDEADVRELLSEILEECGYQVFQAEDGKDALRCLHARQMDLIITDLIMPEQEGLETISRMRMEMPEMKIIAMSGSFEPSYLRVARLLGADRTLQKPFSFDDVLAVVRQLFPVNGHSPAARE